MDAGDTRQDNMKAMLLRANQSYIYEIFHFVTELHLYKTKQLQQLKWNERIESTRERERERSIKKNSVKKSIRHFILSNCQR